MATTSLGKYISTTIGDISAQLTSAVMDEAQKKGEAVLKKHIMSDIYGQYSPVAGHWVGGTTYQRSYALKNSVYSWIEGDTVCITAAADPELSVGRGTVEGPLIVFVQGAQGFGFWTHGFARDAIGPAQAEVDSMLFGQALVKLGLNRLVASGVLSNG